MATKKTKPAATKGKVTTTGTTKPGTLPMPGSTPTSSAKAAGARRAPRPVPTATTVVTSRTTTRTIPPAVTAKPAWHSGWWVLAIAGVLLLTLFFWQFDLWPFNDGNTPEVVQMKESVPVIEATITESDVLVTKKIGEETSSVSIKSPSGAIAVITGNISATNSTVYAGTFYGMPPYGTTAPATVKPTAPTPKRTPVWPENFSPDCREKILDCEPKDGVEVNVEMTIPPRKRVSFITPVGWHINPRMTVDSSNYRCALNLGTVTSPRWVDMTQVPSPTSDQDRVEIAEYGFESLSDSPITVIFNLRGR